MKFSICIRWSSRHAHLQGESFGVNRLPLINCGFFFFLSTHISPRQIDAAK